MKKTLTVLAAAALVVGCDRERTEVTEQGAPDAGASRETVSESVRDAKSAVERQAEAQKERLDAEAKAAEAQIEAQKARAEAAAANAETKVQAASQEIREAAGAAGTKLQTEAGAAGMDRELGEKVKASLNTGFNGEAVTEARAIEVSVDKGVVTLAGKVTSEAEKARLEKNAQAVPGVTKVINKIEVKGE